eukprot:8129629-Pyramimonas_sp.AAC.1
MSPPPSSISGMLGISACISEASDSLAVISNMAAISLSALDWRLWELFMKSSSSVAEGIAPHAFSAKPHASLTLCAATAAEPGAGVGRSVWPLGMVAPARGASGPLASS